MLIGGGQVKNFVCVLSDRLAKLENDDEAILTSQQVTSKGDIIPRR